MAFDYHTFSDGGSRGNPGQAACAAVITDAQGKILKESAKLLGVTTNNVAEYNGMLLALELAQELRAHRVLCTSDSQLIVFQLQGIYRIKDLRLKTLAEKVQSLAKGFTQVQFRQVPRSHPMIARADAVLNQAMDRARHKLQSDPKAEPPGQREFF